ncbi:MAG: hypothetical protein A2W26_05990 [Acidobacteria bacterium RBG_16_64_8]|nr:MAG: hypothetical protein A2W26_05990 [Acidobacteria bacterium RBG_16_64_8]
MTAAEAEAIGLVDRVAQVGKLDQAVMELAESLAAKDPWVLRTAKYLINQGARAELATGLRMEEQAITERQFEAERHRGKGDKPWTSS